MTFPILYWELQSTRSLVHVYYNLFTKTDWLWTYFQHVFGHHPYTNIDGMDPDIITSEDVSLRTEINILKWIWMGTIANGFWRKMLFGHETIEKFGPWNL